MTTGNITRRGKASWRVKYELSPDPETGGRRIAYVTVRGKRADAEKELRRRLSAIDRGIHVDPSALTVSDFLERWLDETCPRTVAPKALERYRGLVRNQIVPHLGAVELQKLRPADIDAWLQALGKTALSVKSIRHAHGVLRTALAHATSIELVERNVCIIVKPPTLERREIEILNSNQIADTLRKIEGSSIYPIVAVAIGTGARQGEIAALRWSDLNLDAATIRIERSLEQTGDGIRIKPPKTAAGRRTLSLPAFTVEALRHHRQRTLELRLAIGSGALPEDAPIFVNRQGDNLKPSSISDGWRATVTSKGLPVVTFHALRHSHASALIAAGLDVVTVSRRLGHASPALTLNVYSHLFHNTDDKAAAAIDAAIGNGK